MLILWILSSVIPLGTAFASPITSQQAQQNVMDFLKKKGKTVAKSALHDISSKGTTSKNYFVFNVGNNEGFVIASADDQVPAILGYSSRGTVLIEAMPANLKAWLDSYDKQISYIQEQGIKGSTPITSTHAAISPLMTTTWDQDDPYNQSCPDFFTYGKSVTGCVATAMAQIMYYHRNRSVSQISATIPAYTCRSKWNSEAGAQQISVAAVPAGSVIDWNNMLTNYTGSETATQKKAVADLMFYCGASVSMNYANGENGGSGAYSEDVPEALKTYFGYSDNTQLVSRDNYTNDSWDNLIYNELSNHRPVFYSGVTSSGGGHAFVCDGYDSDGYYHINWGWGGYCDTYFLLSDLTPQDQGTGGSSGGYNSSQQAMIGAEPAIDNTITLTPIFENGLQSFEVPALYYQPVIYAKDVNSKKEAYYYIDNKGKKLEGLGWRFDDGGNAPIATFPALQWDPATMSGYEYPGEPIEGTMLPLYRDFISKFAALKTAKIVPAVTATYQVSPASFSPNGYTIDFSTSTKIATGKIEMKNTGYENSMADNFASPIDRDGSKYNVEGGVLIVPFKLSDWGKYVEDLWYYFDRVDEETYKDSVNFISLQLTKEGEPTITSEKAPVIHAFLLINGIVDNKPESKVLDCLTTDENWPSKRNENAGTMYKNANQAIDADFTHSIPYNKTLDILPFIETHVTYIGKKSKWTEYSQVMDAATFKSLGLRYAFSVVDYEDGNHATGESRHISIEPKVNATADFGYEQVILTPQSIRYNENGSSLEQVPATREAIDHEPLIKVEIVDSNNNVLYVGYIKLLITDDVQSSNGVILNATNFPDDTFRAYISNLTGVAEGGTISDEKLLSIKSIDVSVSNNDYWTNKIASLKGIEFFNCLTTLKCGNNEITSLDVTRNTALTHLDCHSNRLTSLDVTHNTALTYLDCGYNWSINSIDVTKNTELEYFDCHYNGLSSLDVSKNTMLTHLNCCANRLTVLDVTNNTALTSLGCSSNKLTSLDVSKNIALSDSLGCQNNKLTSLDLSKNTAIKQLYCNRNNLTSLNVSKNTELNRLWCHDNQLTSLDVSMNTAIIELYCHKNQLTNLDVSKNTAITELYCFNNQLTGLDVSKNTAITQLGCSHNLLTSLDVSKNIALESLYCDNNQLTCLNLSGCTALRNLHCGYYEHASLDLSDNPNLTSLGCYHSLSALSTGSNLYNISLPTNFDISRVSEFKVDNVSVVPTVVNGTLLFSTTSIPKRITYKYDVANSTVEKMDVNITITSTEVPNYDNTIYMNDMEVLSGTEAVLSVKMKNAVVAEGFEFDMYLPEGITVVEDEDGFPEVTLSTERTTARKTNSFDAVFNADGSLRVLAASTNGSAISGNDGEVVQVKVALADDMIEGDYTVCFKNIAISDENATSHSSPITTSTIKVNTYTIGDANIDKKVDVADFTATAHHLLNRTPEKFHQKAADANTDNKIDVGDLTAIAHLILYGSVTKPTNTAGARPYMMLSGTPANENYLYIEPVSVQGQSEVTLSVKMKNAVEAEGFEFDLYLPDGMTFVTDADGFAEVSLSTERTNSRKTNSFDAVIQQDGSLRVLAASTNGSSISGNDGEVALVTIHVNPELNAGEYPLLLKNIAISDVNAVSHSTDLQESTITILGNGIVTGLDGVGVQSGTKQWYSLDGKKLNSKPKAKGVYIMNRQKVVIK